MARTIVAATTGTKRGSVRPRHRGNHRFIPACFTDMMYTRQRLFKQYRPTKAKNIIPPGDRPMMEENGPRLVSLEKEMVAKAKELVDSVFIGQTPMERLSLRFYSRKGRLSYRIFSWLSGVDLLDFWVVISDDGSVSGISGLYSVRKDRDEALWLGWYAVRSSERGKGLGTALLGKAIEEARSRGAMFLRLYTSDSELIDGGEEAQMIYEKHGLRIKSQKSIIGGLMIDEKGPRLIRVNKIIREKSFER